MTMKKPCCILLSVLLLLGAALPAAAFGDVPADAYYAAAVGWALAAGVTEGTSAETFSPGDTCTRGQVVTFLWRAMGRPEPETTEEPFTDVQEGDYFYTPVLWAVEWGITNGTSETTFSPKDKCTCAQIITFLWRAAGWPPPAGDSALTAGWPDSYYKGAVSWADARGILADTGAFDPAAACSRAETVAWLYRAVGGRVTVSTAAELMAAICPNRTIYLEDGTYNLTDWIESLASIRETGNPCVRIEEVFDGYEVQIVGADNLRLTGSDAEIVVEPRYADVLSFFDCDGIALTDLTLGHTIEPGSCQGDVLSFTDCGDIKLEGLDLYGCGTYGIVAENVASLVMDGGSIHDCSYGIMELRNVAAAEFDSVAFSRCREFTMLGFWNSGVRFDRCVFAENEWIEGWGFMYCDSSSNVAFDGCTFDLAAYQSITDRSGFEGVSVTDPVIR